MGVPYLRNTYLRPDRVLVEKITQSKHNKNLFKGTSKTHQLTCSISFYFIFLCIYFFITSYGGCGQQLPGNQRRVQEVSGPSQEKRCIIYHRNWHFYALVFVQIKQTQENRLKYRWTLSDRSSLPVSTCYLFLCYRYESSSYLILSKQTSQNVEMETVWVTEERYRAQCYYLTIIFMKLHIRQP